MIERVGYNLETMSDNFQGEVPEPSGLDMLCSPLWVPQYEEVNREDRLRDSLESGWNDLVSVASNSEEEKSEDMLKDSLQSGWNEFMSEIHEVSGEQDEVEQD